MSVCAGLADLPKAGGAELGGMVPMSVSDLPDSGPEGAESQSGRVFLEALECVRAVLYGSFSETPLKSLSGLLSITIGCSSALRLARLAGGGGGVAC
jgi:hypothetical protein